MKHSNPQPTVSPLLFGVIAVILMFLAQPCWADETAAGLIQSASQALKEGNFDAAVERYEKAQALLPTRAEIPYNRGVAHYRRGDFEKAAEAFKTASSLTEDGSLRSRAIYNMGNAAYAQSKKAMEANADPSQPQAQLNQATDLLKDALANYKKAIDADASDVDARANAELSHHLLKRLQEKQQQQQQQDSQQNQDQPDQQQSQQNQQDKQNQQDQQQQNQDQSQDSQSQSDPQQAQSKQQPRPDQQQQEQDQQTQSESANEPPDETSDDSAQATPQTEPSDEKPPPEQGEHVQHPADQPRKQAMTRDEAERLLQAVRDKERKRRADLVRRETVKYAPAEKDW